MTFRTNYKTLIDEGVVDEGCLDEKKEQTSMKIEYITNYVESWLYVCVNRPNINNINFIDCMCNAGIYEDGDLGTCLRVLQLFERFSNEYPDKNFNLILNDYDEKRIGQCEMLSHRVCKKAFNETNLRVVFQKKDVNEFLTQHNMFKILLNDSAANIIFIDPYNIRTVKINNVKYFAKNYYCEIFFNVFSSDLFRNSSSEKIKEALSSNSLSTRAELDDYICQNLKIGRMRFCIPYSFRTVNNSEIYQIVYLTPSEAGLKKLKDVFWRTFDGKSFHRNHYGKNEQLSLLSKEESQDYVLSTYVEYAKELCCKKLSGQRVNYKMIEILILENTMLREGQILQSVLKPLIACGKIKKLNTTSKQDYKHDDYYVQ